ncbi:MAG: hypothetical protein ACFFA3_10895 [Promethearchaeota archaeon]
MVIFLPKVEIRCPACRELGFVELSEELVQSTSRGLLAVNIVSNFICQHSFIVYIDKNFTVRDYFIADFLIEIPDLPEEQKIKDLVLPDKAILNIDLIKLNITLTLLTNLLRAIFCKEKLVLISYQSFLNDHIRNFFNYITKDSFDFELDIISEEEYKKQKKLFKNRIVLDGNKIINDPNSILEEKKCKVERQIVNQFLSEFDLGYSYLTLINELTKAFTYAKAIAKFANAYSPQKKKIRPDSSIIESILDEVVSQEKYINNVVSEYLSKEFKIKIDKTYLNFLYEIVLNYFDVNLKKKIHF